MAKKKVLLFVLEGETDEKALLPVLKKFFEVGLRTDSTVNNGDSLVTYMYRATPRENIGKIVTGFLERRGFTGFDVLYRIVHLIDTDGCYVPESNIIENPHYTKDIGIHYSDTLIETDNVEDKVQRNMRKCKYIETFITSTKSSVKRIPYSIFYFSHNRDHAYFGNHNPSDDEKLQYVIDFRKKYENDFEMFVLDTKKLYPNNIQVNYQDSWNYIKEGTRSLEQGSNFFCFLEEYCHFISSKEEYDELKKNQQELIKKNKDRTDIENEKLLKLNLLINWYELNN